MTITWDSGESERYGIIGKPGRGKTMWLVNSILMWRKRFPNGQIYGNLHVDVPNFHYFPYLFLPWTTVNELDTVFIAIDDPKNMSVLQRFVTILASVSRKINLSCVITAQRDTFITPDVRELLTAFGYVENRPEYRRSPDPPYKRVLVDMELAAKLYYSNDPTDYKIFRIPNALSNVRGRYDTREIVGLATETDILEYIDKCSITRKDYEVNCLIVFARTETRRLMKFYDAAHGYAKPRQSNAKIRG